MPVRVVESKQNARLKELRRALAASGRDSAQGRVGIEGPNLLEEALRAGVRMTTIFVAHGLSGCLMRCAVPRKWKFCGCPGSCSTLRWPPRSPQPIAALVEPPDWTWAHFLQPPQERAALVVVLAGIQDPGNLGTILRSAEAFGADGVVSLPGTVSAWNPKAVRASAGSVFRVPLLCCERKRVP